MLRRDNYIILLFFCLLTFFSCDNSKNKNKETLIIEKRIIDKSESIIGKNDYFRIYNSMNDSIQNWIQNKLGNFGYWNSLIKYRLDSVFCINKERDRLVTAILLQYVGELGVQDDIHFFYGVKIQGKWYYFEGADITLPRENFQKDIHTPLSFSKLHEIAMQEVFSGYLVRKKKDAGFWKNIFAPEYEYEVNESWFDQIGTEKDYVFTKQDSLRMTPDLLDSILILKAYSNWLPESKQNIGYTAPSKWKYFYKTPYPLSIPWEQH